MKKGKIIIIVIVVIILVIILGAVIQEKIEYSQYEKKDKEALKNISIKVPKKFDKHKYSNSISYYLYDDDTSCNLSISVDADSYKHYVDGKDYLEESTYITLKDKVSEIQEIEINNYKWHYLSVEKNGNLSYHYATIKENTIYEIEYRINDYTNGEETNNYCASIKDEIISSIKLK